MNGNKMSGWTIIGIIMIVVLLLSAIGGCDSDSSSDYSSDYRNDKSYRDNVNKVADIFGEDASDVDSKIQAVVDSMK